MAGVHLDRGDHHDQRQRRRAVEAERSPVAPSQTGGGEQRRGQSAHDQQQDQEDRDEQ